MSPVRGGAALAVLALLSGLSAGCDEPLRRRVPPSEGPRPSPASVAASPRATDHFETSGGDLAVAPLEHATLLLVWQGLAIYVDPTSPTVDDPPMPKADFILVTDAHYDHLDPLALYHLSKPGTVVVGSPGVAARAPVDLSMREGETRELARGLTATAVPAYSLARGAGPGLRYHERGQAVGYVLTMEGRGGRGGTRGETRVYVSGDTECTPEQSALTDVDVAFLSLNVPYSMTAAEATRCAAAFRPRVVFPYAYRHAAPATLDRAALGPGIDVRMRPMYPRAANARARAYAAFASGMWGGADDLLDEARRLDPAGENDWRVRWTRESLEEDEKPWPW